MEKAEAKQEVGSRRNSSDRSKFIAHFVERPFTDSISHKPLVTGSNPRGPTF